MLRLGGSEEKKHQKILLRIHTYMVVRQYIVPLDVFEADLRPGSLTSRRFQKPETEVDYMAASVVLIEFSKGLER